MYSPLGATSFLDLHLNVGRSVGGQKMKGRRLQHTWDEDSLKGRWMRSAHGMRIL